MSSLTERAIRRAQWAPVMSALAAGLGLAAAGVFLYQAGLFHALEPAGRPPPLRIEAPEQVSATDTSIAGFDREKQPYQVNAKRALQDRTVANLVHLDEITGTFKKAAGDIYDVAAAEGLYDTKTEKLDLNGGVKITSKDRFTANMEKAHVSVKEKKLTSNVPVTVGLKGGSTIEAGGVEISDDGNRILFVNRVKATFKRSASKGDGPQ
jgi:lipopolysaccharide export system protein LptC